MKDVQHIQMAHGSGGRLARDLIAAMIVPRFGVGALEGLPDAATLTVPGTRIVFSTDSFVVSPLIFPGGTIGDLAVHGSVNDVAVAGGRPRWLSLGLVLEEGLALATLATVLDALAAAAAEAGVAVVTGDTKVVERGKCDGMFINTACIGERVDGLELAPTQLRPGDAILTNGALGEHGLAVMAARHGMTGLQGPCSDTASVWPFVEALLPWADGVRFMRDPTRGGAAGVLNEMVEDRSDIGILLDENALPVSESARAVADLLGIDPLYAACEGRLLTVCASEAATPILEAWRALPGGADAARIGTVTDQPAITGLVAAATLTGGRRIVDMPRGDLLPRIC